MFSKRLSLVPRSTVVGGLVALGVALAGAPAQASAPSPSEVLMTNSPDRLSQHDVAKSPTSFEMDIYWTSHH